MHTLFFPVDDYDPESTLECGQAFRWTRVGLGWEGIVSGHWLRVESVRGGLQVQLVKDPGASQWVRDYFSVDEDFSAILAGFPQDIPMRAAVASSRGLRILRQEPWECLASFICSSTKQIVQIRQIVQTLAARLGRKMMGAEGQQLRYAFPDPYEFLQAGETVLRECKMGFRAPYLMDAARRICTGQLDLVAINALPTPAARNALMLIDGVGPKIADCVLLFAYGRQDAFPIDVWVRRALKDLYFPEVKKITDAELELFSRSYFGTYSGYAQQYLFHYIRRRFNEK